MDQKKVTIGNFDISNRLPFTLLCGPCQIESKQHAIDICGAMREITRDLGINYDDDRKCNLVIRTFRKWHKLKKHRILLSIYLNRIKPDITISMFDYEFSFLYKIKDGSRKVLEFHFCKRQKIIEASNVVMRLLQTVRIWNWNRIVAKYDKFVVLTEEDKCSWADLKNIVVIKNPILKIPDLKSNLSLKRVLTIGRISYQKGFDRLIKAWKIVISRFPDWELNIVGGGDTNGLRMQIQDLGIADSVKIKSATKEIEQEYLCSSIFVMTSRYEGLPMVLLEAMSYGIVVVSFAFPCGPNDLIQPQYGSLVNNGDINGFASALMDWMSHEEKRKKAGGKAIEYVSQFTQEKIMGQWLNLFKSLLE